MSKNNFDSYCGIYCGACSIRFAYETGHRDPLSCHWTEEQIKNHHQTVGSVLTESDSLEQKCFGCKSDTLFINCARCPIRACAIDKKVEHCNDCGEFPCKLLKMSLMNEAIAVHLPHIKMVPINLDIIKKSGVTEWLNQQEKQWKCQECGSETSWYISHCVKCGKELDKDYLHV
ncbi:MAG: DUF3795 domain-containing protein [Candidatus Saccharibacteria bacterium]